MIVCMIGIFILTCTAKKAKIEISKNREPKPIRGHCKNGSYFSGGAAGRAGGRYKEEEGNPDYFCLLLLFSPEIGKNATRERF